jgi:hypothetical protein
MAEGELTVILTDRDGNTRLLDSNAPDPGDRPQDITFNTQRGSGFYTASFALSWPIDAEREDANLLDDVRFVTAHGETVYEGFIAAMPRSTDTNGRGTLTLSCAGYIATASANPFTAIFIDRDLSQWGEMSVAQRIALIGAGYNPDGGNLSTAPDATGKPGLLSSRPGVMNKPINRFVYDAGPGAMVAKLYVGSQTLVGLGSGDAQLGVFALFWSDDNGGNQLSSGDVKASSSLAPDLSATPRRYAVMDWRHDGTSGGVQGTDYGVRWQDVRVVGDHEIALSPPTGTPEGIAASEVIRWIVNTKCPLLNSTGIQTTTYPIPQLTFRERTTPYDAMLKVNSYHLWELAVWEERTVHYRSVDLTDWDWEIRHDEVGNQIGLQGDEYTQLRNGIVVQFTNVETGHVEELLPEDYDELRDDSTDNPFNAHGWKWYGTPMMIPYPTTEASALELGRIQLLEDNQVKAPGSFTVQNTIRDRQGNLQPTAKVRCGDRIRLTSSVNLSDRPRLIHETSYNQESRTVTIGVDSTLRVLEAYLDRTQTALQAAGLT